MKKLKSKLKAMAIYNSAVCNCHKDDEFTPLFDLVEMGYLFLNKTKSTSEKISFGIKLRKALSQFTKRFVPHMKEEEEVFQPLLKEHFSEQELYEMKNVVIKLHMQQRKRTSPMNASSGHVRAKIPALINQTEVDEPPKACISQLPNEILLKIFSCLAYTEVLKCAQVCKKWNSLVYDRSNWKDLRFSDWKSCNIQISDLNLEMNVKDMEYIDDTDEDEFENIQLIVTLIRI